LVLCDTPASQKEESEEPEHTFVLVRDLGSETQCSVRAQKIKLSPIDGYIIGHKASSYDRCFLSLTKAAWYFEINFSGHEEYQFMGCYAV
jgi:hypothetical protein